MNVEHTPVDLKGKNANFTKVLGCVMQPGDNWCYTAGYVTQNNMSVLVVAVQGKII